MTPREFQGDSKRIPRLFQDNSKIVKGMNGKRKTFVFCITIFIQKLKIIHIFNNYKKNT